MKNISEYIRYSGDNDYAKTMLLCFPYAGGGASCYSQWKKCFNNDSVQVLPIQLPGRENLIEEVNYDLNLESIAKDIVSKVNTFIDRPYALFGHSMGGGLAYEFAKEMIRKYNKKPKYLFVSGTVAPHLLSEIIRIDGELSEEQFWQLLDYYNGMDPQIAEIPEMMEYFTPIIKRDFYSISAYHVNEKIALDVPIHIFYAKDDKDMSRENVLAWEKYSSYKITESIFEGGHFYIKDSYKELCRQIEDMLE